MNIEDGESRLQTLKDNRTYRPTVCCVVKDDKGRFLLVRSSMDNSHWYLPQGGILDDESVTDAFYRELYEELGIMVLELSKPEKDLHYGELTIKNYDLGQYKKGKAYFFVLAEYRGPGRFILKRDEVNRYKWATPKQIEELVSQGMKSKGEMILEAIKKVN